MPLKERLAKFLNVVDDSLAHYPGAAKVSQSTQQWMNLHRQTGQAAVFYYRYSQPLPAAAEVTTGPAAAPMLGAAHDAQVAYSLGNLDSQRRYAWTAADYDVSRIFSRYIEQFVKTGNPNGLPAIGEGASVGNAGRSNVASVPRRRAARLGMS